MQLRLISKQNINSFSCCIIRPGVIKIAEAKQRPYSRTTSHKKSICNSLETEPMPCISLHFMIKLFHSSLPFIEAIKEYDAAALVQKPSPEIAAFSTFPRREDPWLVFHQAATKLTLPGQSVASVGPSMRALNVELPPLKALYSSSFLAKDGTRPHLMAHTSFLDGQTVGDAEENRFG